MKTMTKIMTVTFALACASPLFAHEGHDHSVPGAIPAAPHGGRVEEAKDVSSGHKHEGKDEMELFFEALYKNNTLSIYPLGLPTSNPSMFTAVSPKDLTNVKVKVENPRTKKAETVATKAEGEAFTAKIEMKGATRFFIYISADHNKEAKASKIQLEVNG